MKKVYICHPFQNKNENLEKTKLYCLHALEKNYNPISPALYYSQFLDDGKPDERKIGHNCGLDLIELCDELWICGKYITDGMKKEIDYANHISETQCEVKIKSVMVNEN